MNNKKKMGRHKGNKLSKWDRDSFSICNTLPLYSTNFYFFQFLYQLFSYLQKFW